MSDDTTDEEPEEPADDTEEQPDEQPETEDDEQPDIEADERADLSELAEEVEEEAGGGIEETDASEANDGDSSDGDLPTPDDSNREGDTWGDMYVGTLTTFSNAVIEEYGDGETIDEDLARQQHLDEYFNDWMESRGKREDMPPEQALIISTSMFAITVLGTKTDLVSDLLGEADLSL